MNLNPADDAPNDRLWVAVITRACADTEQCASDCRWFARRRRPPEPETPDPLDELRVHVHGSDESRTVMERVEEAMQHGGTYSAYELGAVLNLLPETVARAIRRMRGLGRHVVTTYRRKGQTHIARYRLERPSHSPMARAS